MLSVTKPQVQLQWVLVKITQYCVHPSNHIAAFLLREQQQYPVIYLSCLRFKSSFRRKRMYNKDLRALFLYSFNNNKVLSPYSFCWNQNNTSIR